MKVLGSEVGVFVRIRPSAHVAPDLIECLPDGQVSKTLLSSAKKKEKKKALKLSNTGFYRRGHCLFLFVWLKMNL